MAGQLAVLLERAGLDPAAALSLREDIANYERTLIQLSTGRIEPRKKHPRRDSKPTTEGRPRTVLHVDESGKPQASGPDHFVLCGIALGEEAETAYANEARAIKEEFFKDPNLVFHEPMMRQRADRFNLNNDADRQQAFDDAVRTLLQRIPFTLFGTIVNKAAYREAFLSENVDAYLPEATYTLAMHMLLERFVDYLAHEPVNRLGRVIFESIGDREDAEHQRDYAELHLTGTRYVPESSFRLWLESGCLFSPKRPNVPLEIADLASRDLFEWARRQGDPKFWEVLEPKIYAREDGLRGKFGLKVFPDLDRESTETHRARCLAARRVQDGV